MEDAARTPARSTARARRRALARAARGRRRALAAVLAALALAATPALGEEAVVSSDTEMGIYGANLALDAEGNVRVIVPTHIPLAYDDQTGALSGPTEAGFTNICEYDLYLVGVAAELEEGFHAVDAAAIADEDLATENAVYLKVLRATGAEGGAAASEGGEGATDEGDQPADAPATISFTLDEAASPGGHRFASDGDAPQEWPLPAAAEGAVPTPELLAFDAAASRMRNLGEDVLAAGERVGLATLTWTFSTEPAHTDEP